MKTFILILLSFTLGFAQVRMVEHEFTGTVISITPGYGFALNTISLRDGNDLWRFWIAAKYGESVISKIKSGETISLKVLVAESNLTNKGWRELIFRTTNIYHGMAHEVKLGNQWIPTPFSLSERREMVSTNRYVFLEQKVIGDYYMDGLRKGLILKNGRIAFAIYATLDRFSLEKISVGDLVSFVGFRSQVTDGNIYPIQGVKDVYSCDLLNKIKGPISSFIYKEDFARIGLVVKQKRLSFLPEYAKKIEQFANTEDVTIYFSDLDYGVNQLPRIHAIAQGRDTIFASSPYTFSEKHEHRPVEFTGKISKATYSNKGKLINIIVSPDYFIEVNQQIAEQLGDLLTKGKQLKIIGDEHIKMDGEIYEKNYHIIIPKKVMIDGKEFILKGN